VFARPANKYADLYTNMLLLETQDDDVTLLPFSSEVYFPSRNSVGVNLRKSSKKMKIHVQLRHGDRFQVGQDVFQIELRIQSYDLNTTAVVNMESSSESQDSEMLDDNKPVTPGMPTWVSKVTRKAVIDETPSRSLPQVSDETRQEQDDPMDSSGRETIKCLPAGKIALQDRADDQTHIVTDSDEKGSQASNEVIPQTPAHRGVSELNSLGDNDKNEMVDQENTTQTKELKETNTDSMIDDPKASGHWKETNTDSMLDEPEGSSHSTCVLPKPSMSKASMSSAKPGNSDTKVMFASSTNVDSMDAIMKTLRKSGLHQVQAVKDCDILCVGKGPLKKTSNVIIAISSGKPIVSEAWALDSAKQKKLLAPIQYLASNSCEESGWGIKLEEALERGEKALKPLDGYTILISPALKKQLGKSFEDIKLIATHGGASSVQSRHPTAKDRIGKALIISLPDDPQLSTLSKDGWTCYTKDLVTMSVLRSALDLESDEFVIGQELKSTPPPKAQSKKRKR
jgi:hypothetical protein